MPVYVEWKPYYSVGDPALDAGHQQILGILDELYAAMQRAPNDPASAALGSGCSSTPTPISGTKSG